MLKTACKLYKSSLKICIHHLVSHLKQAQIIHPKMIINLSRTNSSSNICGGIPLIYKTQDATLIHQYLVEASPLEIITLIIDVFQTQNPFSPPTPVPRLQMDPSRRRLILQTPEPTSVCGIAAMKSLRVRNFLLTI